MDMNIFNNKVVARFAFRQMSQAIFKLFQAENALIFTCRQKRHNLKAQSGRSMIEMLGVLAIIGVLSVGGLVGYSKAMERYRVNETINQVNYIVQNTRNLFRNQPNSYGSLDFDYNKRMSDAEHPNRSIVDKAKVFPTALVKNDYKNLFGGEIYYYADGRFSDDDGKAFVLYFAGIPQEACIELTTRDWNSSLGLIVMRVNINGNNDYPIQGSYSGNCTTGYKNQVGRICANDMPMKLDQAVAVCSSEKDNSIGWKFY